MSWHCIAAIWARFLSLCCSFLFCLRRLRGWLYTLMVVVRLLLAFACEVYHGQFMVYQAWAGGHSLTYLIYLWAFMHSVFTRFRHKLCIACRCVTIYVLATSAFLLFVCHASVTFRVFCRKWLDFISRLMFRVISPASSVSLYHYLLHSWTFV